MRESIRRLMRVLACLWFATALAGARPDAVPVEAAKYKEPIKVACLGDSITAGYHAGNGMAWPNQLAALLGDKWMINNYGVGGKTLMKLGQQAYRETPQFKKAMESHPDVVIIALGTNDTKSKNWEQQSRFEADYRELLKQVAALPSSPIIYLCTPPLVTKKNGYGIREAGIVAEIPIITKLAAELKLSLIDLHSALTNRTDLVPDGVHPDAQGEAVLARTVYAALTGKLAPDTMPVVPVPVKAAKPKGKK